MTKRGTFFSRATVLAIAVAAGFTAREIQRHASPEPIVDDGSLPHPPALPEALQQPEPSPDPVYRQRHPFDLMEASMIAEGSLFNYRTFESNRIDTHTLPPGDDPYRPLLELAGKLSHAPRKISDLRPQTTAWIATQPAGETVGLYQLRQQLELLGCCRCEAKRWLDPEWFALTHPDEERAKKAFTGFLQDCQLPDEALLAPTDQIRSRMPALRELIEDRIQTLLQSPALTGSPLDAAYVGSAADTYSLVILARALDDKMQQEAARTYVDPVAASR